MKTTIMILIAPAILALIGAMPNVVRAQVDNNDSWYQQGYSFGLSHGNLVYQTGCPGIANDNNKTQIDSFCLGFEAGQLQVAKNTIHTLDLNRQQNNTQTGSFNGQDFGDLRNVTAGLVNLQTGILHNEQGVFIPWSKICTQGQGLLVQPCSSLVNSDGTIFLGFFSNWRTVSNNICCCFSVQPSLVYNTHTCRPRILQ